MFLQIRLQSAISQLFQATTLRELKIQIEYRRVMLPKKVRAEIQSQGGSAWLLCPSPAAQLSQEARAEARAPHSSSSTSILRSAIHNMNKIQIFGGGGGGGTGVK
jgi:hypothetical protein